MDFTTITNLVRKWKQEFKNCTYKKVLSNNESLWLLVWRELSDALENSWVLEQIREELWEAKDSNTSELIEKYNKSDFSDSITLDSFKKKYEI